MLEEKIKQRKNTGSAVGAAILNRLSRESFPEMVTPKEVMEWAMQMSDHPDRGQQVQRPERAHTWCMWEKARRPVWEESEVRSEGYTGAIVRRASQATVSPLVCVLCEMGSPVGVLRQGSDMIWQCFKRIPLAAMWRLDSSRAFLPN